MLPMVYKVEADLIQLRRLNMTRNTLTVQEAAEYLGVHHDTIYTMVRENQIPHFRVRKRIFFTRPSIDAWINAQENKIIEKACESL